MKTMLALALTFLFAFGGAGSAWAQEKGGYATPAQARDEAASFGKCLISVSRRYWLRLLDEPFGDQRSYNRFRTGLQTDSGCLSDRVGEINFPPLLIRGMLYEALYTADFGNAVPVDSFAGVPALTYSTAAISVANVVEEYRSSMLFGECVARLAPLEARALLLTKVGTPQERAAIEPLTPALQRCVPEGAQVKLIFSLVRGAVAEPLYRLTKMRRSEAAK